MDKELETVVEHLMKIMSINDATSIQFTSTSFNTYQHQILIILPTISFHQYYSRIVKYSECSRSCFLIMLIYLDRIQQYCVHRVILISVMLLLNSGMTKS